MNVLFFDNNVIPMSFNFFSTFILENFLKITKSNEIKNKYTNLIYVLL